MALSPTASNGPLPPKASMRLMAICLFFGLASLSWGYNIGIVGAVYAHPGFKNALGNPNRTIIGFVTSVYYIGTMFSYIYLGHVLADRYGRRVAAASGTLITAIGALLQATASNEPKAGLASIILGRIVCGAGLAIVSSSVPLYQSEIAPAKHRGRYVVINHVGLVVGLAVAFWSAYAMTYWDRSSTNEDGWRILIAIQFVPEGLFLAGVFFCPETPRWLVEHDRSAAAQKSLGYLRASEPSNELVLRELREIEEDAERRKIAANQPWTMLFTHRPLFNRLWRASLLAFLGQMAGNTSMKYFLITILVDMNFEYRSALMIAGIETTLKIFCTLFDSWLVDRYGRTRTLVASCLIMSFSLLMNGVLPSVYPLTTNRVADFACVAFIFIYTFGFSIGFGPAAWVYGSEIFPTNFRARGLNIAAVGSSVGAMISSQIWPIALDKIGTSTYFIFMSFNLVSAFTVWMFYPETNGRSLEDMEALFNSNYRPRTNPEHDEERYHDEVDYDDTDNIVPGPTSPRDQQLASLLQTQAIRGNYDTAR